MTCPNVDPTVVPTVNQPLRLLDQLHCRALDFGHSEPMAHTFVEWSRRFILFHGKQHPRELGLAEVGQFLEDISRRTVQPLRAIEEARTALMFLYCEVLRIDLGEFPRPQPPKLLDRVRQVLRVRHYSPRTSRQRRSAAAVGSGGRQQRSAAEGGSGGRQSLIWGNSSQMNGSVS